MGQTCAQTIRAVCMVVVLVLSGATVGVTGSPPVSEAGEEDPQILFDDQQSDGTTVTVDTVVVPDGGFVAVYDETGGFRGASEFLSPGIHEEVSVTLTEPLPDDSVLTAVAHRDTNANEMFDFALGPHQFTLNDLPYHLKDPPRLVADKARITVAAETPTPEEMPETTVEEPGELDSFTVSQTDFPSRLEEGETLTVDAVVTNPNEHQDEQAVDFRINGTVVDRRTVTLDAGEATSVTFTASTHGLAPGTHFVSVFTREFGDIAAFTVAEPAVSPAETPTPDEEDGDLQAGLVGSWTFDEGEGTTAVDSSGNDNTGTIHGANWTDGEFGSALEFDGQDDYVNVSTDASVTDGNFTVSLWAKTPSNASGNNPAAISMGRPENWSNDLFILYIGDNANTENNGVRIWWEGTTLTWDENVTDGEWRHLVLTKEGQDLALYENGEQVATGSTNTNTWNSTFVGIGAANNSGSITQHYRGQLDNVRVYNRVLTRAEIGMITNKTITSG